MRCLHCNKKLSLLKMAKGDSFCSPEHFDAHQLELSKTAFQRLMSLPADDAPKAPLIIKPREEPQQENAPLARLTAFQPPEPKAIPTPAATAMKVPPYAPFAISRLPIYPPHPPAAITSAAESNELVQLARELAFPVHEVNETVCILNLYLRLMLEESKPRNWKAARKLIVSAEDFRFEVNRPSLGISTVFPQIEIPAPSGESPIIDEVPAIEAAPVPVAPIDIVPVAGSAALIEVIPVGDTAAPVEIISIVESAPPIPSVLPAEPAKPVEPVQPRVPFLIAPSFRERIGTAVRFDGAAGSIPSLSMLAPIVEGSLPYFDSFRAIPRSSRFAAPAVVKAQDWASHEFRSAPALPPAPAFVLPNPPPHVCAAGGQLSDRLIEIGRPAFEVSRQSIRSLDFDLPAPAALLVRPEAPEVRKVDPRQLLATVSTDGGSRFLPISRTHPLGQKPVFVDSPACAMELGLRAIVTRASAGKPFLSATWQTSGRPFPIPASIAEWFEAPKLPADPLPQVSVCVILDCREVLAVQSTWLAQTPYRPAAWREAESTPVIFFADTTLLVNELTILPAVATFPLSRMRMGFNTPSVAWEPRVPAASRDRPAVKCLPGRNAAILPSARGWPTLQRVPR